MNLGELYEEIRAAQEEGIKNVLVGENDRFGHKIKNAQIIHHQGTSSLVIIFNGSMHIPLAKQNAAEALLKWQQDCKEKNIIFTNEEIDELLNQRRK